MKRAVMFALLTALGIQPVDARVPLSMTTADLYGLCTSTGTDDQAICDGYIDSVTLVWNTLGCPLDAADDTSFCSGAMDAYQALREAERACATGCADEDYDDAAAFDQCNANCILNSEEAMGRCTPGAERPESYCLAFNATSERSRALYTMEMSRSPRQEGLKVGFDDFLMQAFATEIPEASFFAFVPCLQTRLRPAFLKDLFLKFVDENPDALSAKAEESATPLEAMNATFAIVAMDRALSASVCTNSGR